MNTDKTNAVKGKTAKFSQYLLYLLLLFLIISIFRNIAKVGEIYRKIAEKEKDVNKLEQESSELERKLEESTSEDYIEKQIRDKLGLAKEGEVVVVLPPAEVLKKYAPKIEKETDSLPDPNWKKWLILFGL